MASSGRTFDAAPESLTIFEPPRKGCIDTEAMDDVYKMIQDNKNKVIHIYGMPGSGKSQIVAVTCQKMKAKGCIVWRVECQQGSEKVKYEWQTLVRQLFHQERISREEVQAMLSALENPSKATMKQFLRAISRMKFHVLLAVELEDGDDVHSRDSMSCDVEILKNFVETLSAEFANVQLLIASRHHDAMFPRSTVTDNMYQPYEVKGFTEKEAKSFLCSPQITSSDEKLGDLSKELAYSPLGLLMARSYCLQFRVSYDTYYDSLGKDDLITEKEKELLKKHPDLGKNHRYEVIMKLLKPTQINNAAEQNEFRVMKMLSFLDKNNIPSHIVECFFKQINPSTPNDIKLSSTHLITKLEERVGCKVDKDDTTGNELISLHGDVLRVLHMCIEDKAVVVADVVSSLTTILDKDNRLRKDYGILYQLKNHIKTVAFHWSDHLQRFQSEVSPNARDYEIMLCLSRINELTGFAISQHPEERENNEEDSYFEMSMECLWSAVTMQTDKSIFKAFLKWLRGKKTANPNLISYEVRKDPQKVAEQVFKVCQETSKPLNEALKKEYYSNFALKSSNLDDMRKAPGDMHDITWDNLKKEIEEGRLSDASYQQLVTAKCILGWEDLRKFYIVERMASILHSRGRQDNYKRDLLDNDMIEKCRWWVDLGFHLCDIAFKKTGFKSSFHFILRANNKLHKLSVNRNGEGDADFIKRIHEVRNMAITIQKENFTFYEHGKYKHVTGTAWTALSASKYLIKANTKVHKRPALLQDYPIRQADKEANDVYNLAIANPSLVIGSTCLVHVGKYFAARRNFPRAFEAFEKSFQIGIEMDANKNPTRFAWALYNMYRALKEAGEDYRDERVMTNIRDRFNMTKKNRTPKEWAIRLSNIRMEVPSSDSPEEDTHVQGNANANTPSGDAED